MSNGRILYQGPSMLDGAEIVVVAVGLSNKSKNSKTGGMIQTHILRTDCRPTDAIKAGSDSSICGECPHRGNGDGSGRTCYVNVAQGPTVVWKTFKAGKYPVATDLEEFRGRLIRFGSYGDPAAVPVEIWQGLKAVAGGHTGYTHQWRDCDPAFADLCMASADSPEEAEQAHAKGYRTFRVSLPGQIVKRKGESVCPASKEAGEKIQCFQCLACGGGKRRGSITIAAHGGSAVMANVRRLAT